jgi:hypothetical protein
MAVSLWFLTPSAQLPTAHFPDVHTPLMQSLPMAQPPCGGHGVHCGPPQSTSVSAPFIKRSVQEGISQMFPVQVPLVQSSITLQCLP